MSQAATFTGIWHCTYWYPSNEVVGDEPSDYDMKVHQTGDQLVFESIPNEAKSYMFIRLTIQDMVASGSWHETTSPSGEFKGADYSGTGQLLIGSGNEYLEGKWVGAGFDHKLQEMRIYSGNWELRRLADS